MIKEIGLALITLGSLNPSYRSTSTSDYIERTYNKTNSPYYYDTNQQSYAYNSYIEEDNYTILGGVKIRSKILTINSFSTTNNVTTALMAVIAYTSIESQSFTVNLDYRNFDQINNWDINNFNYIKTAWHSANQTSNTRYSISTLNQIVYAQHDTYAEISQQFLDIYNTVTNTGGWTDTKELDKSQIGNEAFQQGMDQIYSNTQTRTDYTNNSYGYQVIADEQHDQSWIYYIQARATITDMTELDRVAYSNTFAYFRNNQKWTITQFTPFIPTTTPEVIDIPGLMFSILGMPFAWISTAFNFTLFPGTQYAINISHVFMTIIVVSILIFILKKVLK